MLRRELVEELRDRKNAMINALWSNPNWDGEEANRSEIVAQIEDDFDKAVAHVYGDEVSDEDEIDWDDPFFAKARKGTERILAPGGETADDVTVGDMRDAEADARAAEEYWKTAKELDQA